MVDTRCTSDPARSIPAEPSDRFHDGRAGDTARLRRRRLSLRDDFRVSERIRSAVLGYRCGGRRLPGAGTTAARSDGAAHLAAPIGRLPCDIPLVPHPGGAARDRLYNQGAAAGLSAPGVSHLGRGDTRRAHRLDACHAGIHAPLSDEGVRRPHGRHRGLQHLEHRARPALEAQPRHAPRGHRLLR